MTEAINLAQDESKSLILNFLSESQNRLSAREISEAIDIPMPTVSRLLNSLRGEHPEDIQLIEGKYEFSGDIRDLPPIPEGCEGLIYGIPSSQNQGVEGDELADIDVSRIGPVGQQILEHLTVKNKVPLSGVVRKFNLEEDEAGFILDELENQNLISKEHMDNFDEDCFSIEPKGKALVERSFSEPSNIYPFDKASSNKGHESTEHTKAEEEVVMTESQRTFEIPSFDDIPEENSSSRGRPTGDRDYENLRVCMLGYIEKYEPCAKSNISHTLARVLTNFGRQSIASEVDTLVDHGYVKAQVSGKREVFSLTALGHDVVSKVQNGEAIEPLVQGGSAPAPSKAKTAPQNQPQKEVARTKVAEPENKQVDRNIEPARHQESAPKAAPAPQMAMQRDEGQKSALPSSTGLATEFDRGDLQNTINELLSKVPGETSYQLRYCFDQLNGEVKRLKHKNELLNNMNRMLTEEL